MGHLLLWIGAIAALLTLPAAAQQSCSTLEGESAQFAGEISGQRSYEIPLGAYTFVLDPIPYGWRIAMHSQVEQPLVVFSPPLHPFDTNAINISGWHFRNGDNTGPNSGDVSAPQTVRRFTFGAADNFSTQHGLPPEATIGRGELIIEEYGLADLAPGQRARMVFLRFRGCLQWRSPSSLAPIAAEEGERVELRACPCGLLSGG